MYPIVQVGPLNLSSSGLLLVLAVLCASWLVGRVARARGGVPLARQADSCFFLVLLGAVLGARLWYGLFNWDLYGQTPSLFLALRVGDMAWPGALFGGAAAGYLWCKLRGYNTLALADNAPLVLPFPQVVASVGLLLSGEALGTPTTLPWGIDLFGTTRHPTQLYFALAALLSLIFLRRLARYSLPTGTLMAAYLGLHGLALLLIEALRADSLLLPGGIRAAQVFGLVLLLYALHWMSRHRSGIMLEQPGKSVVETASVCQTTDYCDRVTG